MESMVRGSRPVAMRCMLLICRAQVSITLSRESIFAALAIASSFVWEDGYPGMV